jgi:hypothetical protein
MRVMKSAPFAIWFALFLSACLPALPAGAPTGAARGPIDAARERAAATSAGPGPEVGAPFTPAPNATRPIALPPSSMTDAGSPLVPADAHADADAPPALALDAHADQGDVPADQGDARADLGDGRTEVASDVRGSEADAATEVRVGARAPSRGDLVIDELLIDPTGNDLGREWIELLNLSADALDLAELHLADDSVDVAVAGGTLAPRAILVLAQSADPAHNGGITGALGYGTRLSLNNGADRVSICAGPCATGAVLDAFAWTAAPGPAHVGHALIITPMTGATCPAVEAYGTGGSFGTPGQPNPPCPPPPPTPDAGAGG